MSDESKGAQVAGWKLVPVDPTMAMQVAGTVELHRVSEAELEATGSEIGAAYRAMLAAAPQPPEAQAEQALRWATNLARSLARKHYPEAPQFEPLPDLVGVISQIDNMTTGLVRAHPPAAPAALRALTDEQIDNLRGLDTAKRVRFYEHDFYVLSNFSAFTLYWRGTRFDTSEAAYHYEKFPHDEEVRSAIRGAPSAHEAFKIAERNKSLRRPDWDDVKVGIMLNILRAKAAQHLYVRRKLLDTGDRELVEDSWRDDFWGWGPNRDGQNMLGRLWMQVRAELRAAGDAEKG